MSSIDQYEAAQALATLACRRFMEGSSGRDAAIVDSRSGEMWVLVRLSAGNQKADGRLHADLVDALIGISNAGWKLAIRSTSDGQSLEVEGFLDR